MAGTIFLAFLCIRMAIISFLSKKIKNRLDSGVTRTYYTLAL